MMHLPPKWYVHVLPGTVILATVVFALPPASSKDFLNHVSEHLALSVVLLGIFSFTIGFVINALLLNIVKPITDKLGILSTNNPVSQNDWVFLHRIAIPYQIDLIKAGYDNMVLYRSLLFSAILAEIVVLRRAIFDPLWWWTALGMTVVIIALFRQWKTHRHEYQSFLHRFIWELRNRPH
jgi:hypothetical protein